MDILIIRKEYKSIKRHNINIKKGEIMPFGKTQRHYQKIHTFWFFLSITLAVFSFFIFNNLEFTQRIVLSTIILAGCLWITDAIPLFVTSMIIPLLLALFGVLKPKEALNPFFDPIIVLFLGSLLIARALRKLDLDLKFANWFLPKISNAKILLFALIACTAFLSLWMANTAAAAIMLPIGLAVLQKIKDEDYSKAVVLGIAYGASIGGMGTLVGTPPNALASGLVEKATGSGISFLEWLFYGLPITIILIFVCFILLLLIYKPKINNIEAVKEEKKKLNNNDKLFLLIFILTVVLWLTEPIHGISTSIVALGAGILLFLVGILNEGDINTISWSVLILFGGGLVLGEAVTKTGFAQTIVVAIQNILGTSAFPLLLLGLITIVVLLGAFVSNTAVAAILIPLLMPLSVVLGVEPKLLAVTIAIAVSFDFLLPIGTPPNAMAYNTGYLKIREMVKTGIILTAASIIVLWLFILIIS